MEASTKNRVNTIKERFDSISYKGVVFNVPYLIFLAVLAILYITNNNKGVSLAREIDKRKKELKEVRWRYKDAQANLIYQTSESQIRKEAANMGIMPLQKPAFEIKAVDKK